jgi:hypothetical protein
VTSRLLVLVSLAFAHVVADTIGSVRPAVPEHLDRGLLDWDAQRYMQIAQHGYGALRGIELRFFPLLPLLARALNVVLPGGAGAALLVVSNVAAFVFGWLVWRLVVHEKGDAALGLAGGAVWLTFLAPAAFVLVWGYSEALWGCVTVGMFLALRRQQWWLAAVVGVLAGLTRPVAPLLVLPALIECGRGVRAVPWRSLVPRAAAVGSPVVGVCVYLAWVHAQGHRDWLLPYHIQQDPKFRGRAVNPVTAVVHAVQAGFDGDWIALLRVAWVVVLLVAIGLCLRDWPLSYGVFAGAIVLVALSTQRLGSFERYGFSAFPVMLGLAGLVRRREALYAVGAACLLGYGTLALLGSYVP